MQLPLGLHSDTQLLLASTYNLGQDDELETVH